MVTTGTAGTGAAAGTSAGQPRGLAGGDLDQLGARVLRSWDSFLDLAATADPSQRTRLPGWRVRELLLHLGTWPDKDSIAGAVASARNGTAATAPAVDPDRVNAAVVAAHADATVEEISAALRRTRDTAAALLRSQAFRTLGTTNAVSWVGPIPLATFLHASCYELAVHALDLAAAGAPQPPDDLLDAGVAALMDVTGALSARHRVDASVAVCTPYGGWQFAAREGDWTTGPASGVVPTVTGAARDVLEASSGRASVPGLLLRRRLKLSDVAGFLALAPLVEQVPTLPGGPLLTKAATLLGGLTRRP